MKRVVLGLGGAQVLLSFVVFSGIAWLIGMPPAASVVIGGMLSLWSTAIVMKLLVDQLEQNSRHGRAAFGILLFQDLVVVPFLIGIPALGGNGGGQSVLVALGWALVKGAAVLAAILFAGRMWLRPVFHEVALARSREFFMLTVLLITLAAAWFTEHAGLSLALGAFLAGLMLGETEYRHQVESDILPFRISEVSSRNYRVHTTQTFDSLYNTRLFNFTDLLKEPTSKVFNLYYSLATFKDGVPKSGWSQKDRGLEEWRKTAGEQIIAFDFLLDIDARPFSNIMLAHEDFLRLHGLLQHYGVCHEARYSGSGFHIIIPHTALPALSLNPMQPSNLYEYLAKCQHLLHKKVSSMIDKTTFDSRQLVKLPYSVANLRNGQYLCLPFLSEQQAVKFNPSDAMLSTIATQQLPREGRYFFNVHNLLAKEPFEQFMRWVEEL